MFFGRMVNARVLRRGVAGPEAGIQDVDRRLSRLLQREGDRAGQGLKRQIQPAPRPGRPCARRGGGDGAGHEPQRVRGGGVEREGRDG